MQILFLFILILEACYNYYTVQDTVVRWSAAKGIGRITARLTSSLSEEVLSSILELFSPGEVCCPCFLLFLFLEILASC